MHTAENVIFVVDDEVVIAQTVAIILNQSGFVAMSFTQPEKAIEAIERIDPGLLISDVMMPGLNGIELAIRFQTIQPACNVLLFSGQAGTSDLISDARLRGYDFELLAKPLHPRDLLARVHQWKAARQDSDDSP